MVRELVKRYFDNGLSRRGFARRLAQLGFTAAAAQTMLAELDAADPATTPKADVPSATMTGTGGELVVAQAKAAGVEYVFTNPGSFEVGFFDALLETPNMHMIMGLHEGIVVSMADGYHRVSLKPAFVNLHVIAGTAQAAGQLFNASRDGSALVVTAGLNDNQSWSDDTTLAPRPGFDQKEVNRQFTKISWDARQAPALALMLRRAFKTAMSPPGGPVYLAMAHYALESKNIKAEILPASRFMLPTRVRPETSAVEEAAKMLVEAKNPLLVVGDEIWKAGAQAEVVKLSEKLGLPITQDRLTTYKNTPVMHAHFIGNFSMESPFVKNCDLMVFIGSRDFGGKVPPPSAEVPSTARMIRIGMDTTSMSRNYATDIGLVGDVKLTVSDLLTAVESIVTKQRLATIGATRAGSLRAYTATAKAKLEATVKKVSGTSPMDADEIGAVLARTMDKNAILVSENLTAKYDSIPFGYHEDQPMYVTNTGLGLGWGIGAATGAKLAAPDRQVVCSIGDGSVMYSASGFWTQARYDIPVITVIYNNKNYQTVRHAYHAYKGKMTTSGKYVGMYLGDPDINFVKLAESQGVKAELAQSGTELEAAMIRGAKAARDGKPYVIEVATARYGGGAESTWHEGFKLGNKKKA